ncbi:MAG: hypothetical protein FRX49_12106 [Trebouxia sp. A1-2]|nr:MAG: hypothetical protein FRX49_12106 [Trebouxia sp. A1-2]
MFLSFSAARLPSLTGEGERALLGDSARPAAESCTTPAACTLAQTVVTSYIAKHHVNVIEHCRQTQTNSMVAVLTNAEKHVRDEDCIQDSNAIHRPRGQISSFIKTSRLTSNQETRTVAVPGQKACAENRGAGRYKYYSQPRVLPQHKGSAEERTPGQWQYLGLAKALDNLLPEFFRQGALQEAASSGLDPKLRLLKLLFYLVPQHLAKQGSLSIQGRKDGGEPLSDELAYTVLVGEGEAAQHPVLMRQAGLAWGQHPPPPQGLLGQH